MQGTYGDRIKDLEKEIQKLNAKIDRLANVNKPYKKPHSSVQGANKQLVAGSAGMNVDKALLPWNDTELTDTDSSTKGRDPKKGLNCHTHSRYSGGALIVNSLELVEYNIDFDTDENYSKHNLGLWSKNPPIAKAQKTDGEEKTDVDKIGLLDCEFNVNTGKWGVTSYTTDIKNTYFIEYDENGVIALDENEHEKKAPLWNEDATKSAIVWDKNARCWRLFCTFANYITTAEEEA